MAIDINEPRALTAALAAPVFHTRGDRAAMRVANRHVERWAPEASANRVRSMRTLGFVDRLVSPWIETAQRSASQRLFSNYTNAGVSEREGNAVSWVFPRPWFQDEIGWMAAARRAGETHGRPPTPTMLTTRGTYVAPQRELALPAAIYEYVAPSLSIAPPQRQHQQPSGVGYGGHSGRSGHDAYSPLIPLAAVQAAALMAKTVAPLVSTVGPITPALRTVLTSMLQRAAAPEAALRLSTQAPELVMPPAPRAERPERPETRTTEPVATEQLAVDLGQQRAQIAKLQQIAQQAAQREMAARAAARAEEMRAAAQRAEVEGRQRAEVEGRQRAEEGRQQSAAERARVEERIAQRLAERAQAPRLHEHARTEAAAHVRVPVEPVDTRRDEAPPQRAPAEVMAAVAALPPELATYIASQRPERAAQAISEIKEALRNAELMTRSTAANAVFEVTRGPRLMLPAGIGGLVSAVDRAHAIPPSIEPESSMATHAMRAPALPWVVAAPTSSALNATASAAPAAIGHVAWADRWLARFAGASTKSLDVLHAASGSDANHFQALAHAAPDAVFVSPMFDSESVRTNRREPGMVGGISVPVPAPSVPPVQRFDDSAETPDDVFAAIAASVANRRAPTVTPAPTSRPTEAATDRYSVERYSVADAVAQSAPTAPNAGLSAQLASSPFAAALRHVMPLPTAPSFDVRSLFAGGLSATYLAGLLAPASQELEIATMLPAWTRAWASPARMGGGEPARARAMIDTMSLPMIASEPADRATSRTQPGMVAERAHGWSVAQERSAADLSLDFVTPELVLAARVYGLGPAEAAQAARLALAGPGQLAAMAGTVDRAFVQAMAIETDRRSSTRPTITTAFPTASGEVAVAPARVEAPAATSFGVERRAPRGAVLWPSATVAALGLNAAAPDGQQSMSVAALELLAAQAVAEIGTYAALGERDVRGPLRGASQSEPRGEAAPIASTSAMSAILSGGAPLSAAAEPAEADVLHTAATLVHPSRHSRFETLYIALSQTPSGRTWSPAARAARAVALASRGDDAPTSAYERAAAAWDVLPVVYATDGQVDRSGTRSPRASFASDFIEPISIDGRPGLNNLSARAGEALGSYVAPIAPSITSSAPTREREPSVYERAPSAAPELVRTGRPAGRHGGGEVEIPSWFESAARRMLSERSGNSDGISMAELTLVSAAPPSHVAASSIGMTAAVPLMATMLGNATEAQDPSAQIDIEKLANEVYRQILVLMDAARQRNGEPYL